jgi:hypothetical protein
MTKRTTLSLLALSLLSSPALAQDWAAIAVSPLELQIPGTHLFNFTVKNVASTGFQPSTLYWQQDNGAIQSVALSYGDYKIYSLAALVKKAAMTVTLPAVGGYQLKAWIKVTGDTNPANDTVTQTISVYDALPKKNVVFEVFKHQKCGPCYEAAVYTNKYIAQDSNYAVANIYTDPNDVIYNSDGAVMNSAFGFAHPAPVYDRFQFPFFASLEGLYVSGGGMTGYKERERYYEPLQVYFKSVSYDVASRQLKIKVAAKAWLNTGGDLRFNVYLTEDDIKAYQEDAPDPYNYYHKRVLRAMLGGPWGVQGSLPATINKSNEYEYEFTYGLPYGYDRDKMHLIALVQHYDTDKLKRRILNSAELHMTEALSVKETTTLGNVAFSVYPNPAQSILKVSFGDKPTHALALSLADMTGKVHITQNITGDADLDITQLAAGTYILSIDDGQVVSTCTVVKN